MTKKLAIVIVTYNRLEKLKKTLECYNLQTSNFYSLIVVNNNSTDGTKEYLKEWECVEERYKKVVLNLKENIGGSGGFYCGIKEAIEQNVNWIWVADDDAYPESKSIEKFYAYINNVDVSSIAAVCGAVYSDGKIDLCHRKYIKKSFMNRVKFLKCPIEKYSLKSFKINLFSYVGSIINAEAIKSQGNTNKKLFIYYDDTEHSIRLSKYGEFICIPDMKIIHDSGAAEIDKNQMFSWRNYYLIRNRIFLLKEFYYCEAIINSILTIVKSYIKYYFKLKKNYNKQSHKLTITAVKDAWSNNLGKNELYKPGYKIV